MNKIAILGANGHIGRNLVWYLSQEQYDLFLFSRKKDKLADEIKSFCKSNVSICTYADLDNYSYDAIINCIGISDPQDIQKKASCIMQTTEYYDNQIIGYVKNKKDTVYINMSSGSVYGHQFANPVNDLTQSELDLNKPGPGLYYSLAKLYSEVKHRALSDLNIIDLRIFGFFSRFIDITSTFFMSELVLAIKNGEKFYTDKDNFVRDYVHPRDLFSIVQKCLNKNGFNDAFDVYSKGPISKFEILDTLARSHKLKYEISIDRPHNSPTGTKENYYSLSRKAGLLGYKPQYSSLETIVEEIKEIIG